MKCKSKTFPPPFYFSITTVRAYLLCDSFLRFRFDLFFFLFLYISLFFFSLTVCAFYCVFRMYCAALLFHFIARATAVRVGSTIYNLIVSIYSYSVVRFDYTCRLCEFAFHLTVGTFLLLFSCVLRNRCCRLSHCLYMRLLSGVVYVCWAVRIYIYTLYVSLKF